MDVAIPIAAFRTPVCAAIREQTGYRISDTTFTASADGTSTGCCCVVPSYYVVTIISASSAVSESKPHLFTMVQESDETPGVYVKYVLDTGTACHPHTTLRAMYVL